jgi:hypothetical protein
MFLKVFDFGWKLWSFDSSHRLAWEFRELSIRVLPLTTNFKQIETKQVDY